jgi:hypothetical protein
VKASLLPLTVFFHTQAVARVDVGVGRAKPYHSIGLVVGIGQFPSAVRRAAQPVAARVVGERGGRSALLERGGLSTETLLPGRVLQEHSAISPIPRETGEVSCRVQHPGGCE